MNIESSVLLQHQDDLHVVVNNYVKERVVTVRPSAPRYTVEVTAEKRKLRQLERKWRASRLPADRVRYVHQCNVVINLIKSLKSEYYSFIIKENSGNKKFLFKTVQKLLQKPTVSYYPPSKNDRILADEFATFFTTKKFLFKTVQKLLQKPTVSYYPPSKNDRILADEFATFFTTKIDTLHNGLLVKKKALIYSADCVTDEVLTMSSTKFSIFTEMKLDDIRELTATMFSKSSDYHPPIIKQCIDLLLPLLLTSQPLSS